MNLPNKVGSSEVVRQTVHVNLAERSYPILLSSGDFALNCKALLRSVESVSHLFIIADQAVAPYLRQFENVAHELQLRATSFVVPSGEGSKSIAQCSEIWNAMYEAKTDRASIVIAIGGGVIGDLAGFAAASFARGLRFIQIPTTLLAMVDSSVGGKTGINLPKAKNMVGAFWQPTAVVIDTATLSTLAEREFRSGLAEVVKYGVILDPDFFRYLEENAVAIGQRETSCIEHIIVRSCQLKADVVQRDERETTGLRAILNYGHTFAHAIESATEYGCLLHGEAVSIGMTMAANLAVRLNMFSSAESIRQRTLLESLGLPVSFKEIAGEKLWELMQHDKKVEQGVLSFILPTRIGHVERRSGVTASDAIAACASHVHGRHSS
jgi:3-dehydroquinate synthase